MKPNAIHFIQEFKMDIEKINHLLLNELLKEKEGILAISLAKKFTIPLSDFLVFINRNIQKKIISLNQENKIVLTESGIKQLQPHFDKIKAKAPSYFDLQRLDKEQIDINEPYIPNINFINDFKGKANRN